MDDLDRQIYLQARLSRDPRFDGRFFIGVRSTRIYCRSICPVRTVKDENVRYFPTAAAAAEAGYRPCLRCRPESSPGTPAWFGSSATVSRALRIISESPLENGGVEHLAARLGIGSRQLRRLFLRHLGASPRTIAKTRRLHFAKKLIDETHLPMSEIALTAGFGSVRRFNAAFRETYKNEDVGSALKFLSKAFGFRKFGYQMRGKNGKINHAAMKLGDDSIILKTLEPQMTRIRTDIKLSGVTQLTFLIRTNLCKSVAQSSVFIA